VLKVAERGNQKQNLEYGEVTGIKLDVEETNNKNKK